MRFDRYWLAILLIILGFAVSGPSSRMPKPVSTLTFLDASPFGEPASAVSNSSSETSHEPVNSTPNQSDTVALVLISLVVILLSAKLGGDLFERVKQPAVLGELVFGVILGNLSLMGYH